MESQSLVGCGGLSTIRYRGAVLGHSSSAGDKGQGDRPAQNGSKQN